MPFQTCLTILICIILGISGCMKAMAPKPMPLTPAPPKPQVELKGPYESEIPAECIDRLARIFAADEAAPLAFLSIADHFAVRGQFAPEDILSRGLLLAPGEERDGLPILREIFSLRFHGRAVMLSRFDTLPARDPEGKGLPALQTAFLNSGLQTVISTLWLSDDRAAGRITDIFYRRMKRKESFADALATDANLSDSRRITTTCMSGICAGGEILIRSFL